jgi:hypothetical protein
MHDRKKNTMSWNDSDLVPRVKKIRGLQEASKLLHHRTFWKWILLCQKIYWAALECQYCGCGEWQLTRIPCEHAVHVITYNRLNMN